MTTAQDVREKTFEKSFNGYNMGQVDEFLDQIAADLSALAKENATLKGRMRVLVEKIEEYRQTEDSMRLALMSAQKMSAQIESEAKEKADAMIAQAKDSADALTRHATDGIANEEAKLEEAKKATAKFFDHMRAVCEKQIAFYEKLSRMDLVGGGAEAERPAPGAGAAPAKETDVDRAVKSIEASAVHAALSEPEEHIEVDTELPEEDEPTRRFGDANPRRKGFDDDI